MGVKFHTEETKRKISESKKGKLMGKDNPFCKQCNLRANSNRDYWIKFYQEKNSCLSI